VRFYNNVWTLTVNLGWLVALGVIAAPYLQTTTPRVKAASTVELAAETQSARAIEAAPRPNESERKQPATVPEPVLLKAVPKKPVLRVAERPEPAAKPVDELGVPGNVQAVARMPEDFLPEKGGSPAVICEGGMCRIDPRYKYDAMEDVRVGPEPVIYFPQPPYPNGIPPGETPRSAKARYANSEMRFALNQFKGRLKWTPKVFQYLDLSEMGACPWDLEKVFDQNWELKWRLRQIGLLTQGYDTEGLEAPRRPRGKAGLVGVYPSTLGQLQ
jgi:hypothetical protein